MKTRQEVENLKKQWDYDPCFDLEDVEGYEEYHDELKTYSIHKNQEWENYRKEKEEKAMQELGISNIKLLKKIEQLESRIEHLENYIKWGERY